MRRRAGKLHEHWTWIRTNNGIERIIREIRRRTRVVGSFPDGNSALMLVCARLRYVSTRKWGYLNPNVLLLHQFREIRFRRGDWHNAVVLDEVVKHFRA